MTKTLQLRNLLVFILYLIVAWTAFRLSGIVLPQEVDEFIIKPIVWIIPVLILVRREGKGLPSLGITPKNLLPGIYLAVILGLVFAVEAVAVNFLKYGTFTFANYGNRPLLGLLVISLAAGISEELVFRGYIFNRFWTFFKNEILANLLTSVLWVLIHVPVVLAVLGYSFTDSISFWFLAFIYSIGACFIFARTKNIFSAILLYVLWEAPLILLR